MDTGQQAPRTAQVFQLTSGNRKQVAAHYISTTLNQLAGSPTPPAVMARRLENALTQAHDHGLALNDLVRSGAAYVSRNAWTLGHTALHLIDRMSRLYGTGPAEALPGTQPGFVCREFMLLANKTAVFFGDEYAHSTIVSPTLGVVRPDGFTQVPLARTMESDANQQELARINAAAGQEHRQRFNACDFQQRLCIRVSIENTLRAC